MTTVKVTNINNPEENFILITKNKNIKQAIYVHKVRNNIKYQTTYETIGKPSTVLDDLFDLLKKDTNSINTARNYLSSIKIYLEGGNDINDIDNISNYSKTLPLNSKKKFLYSMIKANAILYPENAESIIIPKILTLLQEVKGLMSIEQIDSMTGESVPSKISVDEVQEKAKVATSMYKFIAEFYAKFLPWRCDTVVQISKNKSLGTNINYINLKKGTIQLNKYKTFHTYGQRTVTVPKDVMKLIRKQFKTTNSDWLFPNPKDITMHLNADTLCKILYNIFGVGIRDLRHTFLTNARKTLNKEDFIKACLSINTSAQSGLTIYNDTKTGYTE